MKKIMTMVGLFAALLSSAQTDSAENKSDTIKVGNFIIIKKDKNKSETGVTIDERVSKNKQQSFTVFTRPKRKGNVSTNWWIFDIGFANMRDQTDYTAAQAGSYFKTVQPAAGAVNANSYRLNTGKSSNVNIWFFMKKLNISKHVLNLKYGLGVEMYNFRYDTRISYRKYPEPFVMNDSIGFRKNKLFVEYLTVPLMLNVNPTPDKTKGFSFSAGISAGYFIAGRNKQISSERGKEKVKGDFDFEPFRIAAIGELGIGPVRLYGTFSLNKLQKDITRVEQYPFAVGVRLSNW